MLTFIKEILTWWNRQTIGTRLHTFFFGNFVGKDEFGNKYYSSSKGKRWVVYKNNIEASKIPPEWHLWIHHLIKNIPTENKNKFSWQKRHVENLTGSKEAYRPAGSLISKEKKNMRKYETWKS